MRTIGLTGGIACGKSTVAELLRQRGVPVVDADRIARELVEPGQPVLAAITRRFGTGVLDAQGRLDRDALRAIITADPRSRKDLEAVTHPAIRVRIAEWLCARAAEGVRAAAVEAALLVETGSWKHYDVLVVVRCSPTIQVRRLVERRGLDEPAARAWLATQYPIEDKVRLADVILDNDGDLAELEAELDRKLPRILGYS